jgi:outer membrane lipoprotein-sorting protein
MKFLRRISTRQLLLLSASVVALVIGATVIAMATTGGGPKPAPKKLPVAVHDALTAAPVQGVSARIQFTNNLIDGASVQGSDPILTGASGRLWASASGRLRLELQSDASKGGVGDAQVLVDHRQVSVYDSASNTVYKGKLPRSRGHESGKQRAEVPSLARIQQGLGRLAKHAVVSRAIPSDVAGRPTYTVRVTPKHDGGLLGGAELAWDSVHGTPLRAAVYASGDSSPVLELKATDISFGPVSSSVFDVAPPKGAKVTNLSPPSKATGGHEPSSVRGVAAVRKQASFPLTAPRKLAGLPRGEVRLISSGKRAGALVTYGRGLGGIAVIESPASAKDASGLSSNGEQPGLPLPKVSINGASGEELDTALGTLLRFQRGGVAYTVVGSVPPAAAEAAARGL